MRERERTREIERDFPPSACCPREAIRRGQEKKKIGKRQRKNKNELFAY
jgi:hypothetical protein